MLVVSQSTLLHVYVLMLENDCQIEIFGNLQSDLPDMLQFHHVYSQKLGTNYITMSDFVPLP